MKSLRVFFTQFSLIYALKFSFLELVRKLLCKDSHLAYSQTGEDIIIHTILKSVTNGFYVEVGSNEPIQHSNTFKLYQKGWYGITIDANEKMVNLHKNIRINDTAICAAVSDEEREVTFYEYEMDEISSIDDEFYKNNLDTTNNIRQSTVITRTLESILIENLPSNTSIDLLSIDVEGHDYQVLNSINLTKYRPKLIIIEMHDFDLTNPTTNSIYTKLILNNYKFLGYVIWNGYFVSNEFSFIL